MRTSLIALGLLTLGLAHCSGDRGLFVGEERDGGAGDAGDPGTGGGAMGGSGMTGGSGGTDSGGTDSRGGSDSGGTDSGGTDGRGGSGTGAEGGEPGTGGTGTGARGGTDAGGGSGDAGSGTIGGTGGTQAGMGGVAARGGVDAGGRAGASNAGAGGRPTDAMCTELAREYLERLASAQQCVVATVEQCSREMRDDLFCGCPTFVNPTRESDIRRMLELIELGKNCVRICPAIVCRDVKRGQCGAATDIISARNRCIALP